MKVVLILLLVGALVVGLLLTLRTSRNAGMPSEDVIQRAKERSRLENQDGKDD